MRVDLYGLGACIRDADAQDIAKELDRRKGGESVAIAGAPDVGVFPEGARALAKLGAVESVQLTEKSVVFAQLCQHVEPVLESDKEARTAHPRMGVELRAGTHGPHYVEQREGGIGFIYYAGPDRKVGAAFREPLLGHEPAVRNVKRVGYEGRALAGRAAPEDRFSQDQAHFFAERLPVIAAVKLT